MTDVLTQANGQGHVHTSALGYAAARTRPARRRARTVVRNAAARAWGACLPYLIFAAAESAAVTAAFMWRPIAGVIGVAVALLCLELRIHIQSLPDPQPGPGRR